MVSLSSEQDPWLSLLFYARKYRVRRIDCPELLPLNDITLQWPTSTYILYFKMHRNTGRIITNKEKKNNGRKVFLNVLLYCHLDINLPTQSLDSNFNVLYSKSAAVNFSFWDLKLIAKARELSLRTNRVECLLMSDFKITTGNIGHSRSQVNSTNSQLPFTLLAWVRGKTEKVFRAFW